MKADEVLSLLKNDSISIHEIEKYCENNLDAIIVRRRFLGEVHHIATEAVPLEPYDYDDAHGVNCENIIGYISLPLGICGPLILNEKSYFVPLATTEGALVASVNRGCKAIRQSGGARSYVLRDGMTRAPCLEFPDVRGAVSLKDWLADERNYESVRREFESTTSYGKLLSISSILAGRLIYLRFECSTGDAMGMNMVTKGVEKAVQEIQRNFPDMRLLTLSGNACSDKKSAAINWVIGRGKSIAAEVFISKEVVQDVLGTTVDEMISVARAKNLIGSAVAGSVGGCNAQAANIVAAVFIATGQDPAHVVEGSNCLTLVEKSGEHECHGLHVSVTMPSLQVGTIGGGTSLPAQAACLQLLGCKGSANVPGENAKTLSQIIAGLVLAGEISLLAALCTNTLVETHMLYNRKK